ncbi:aldose 1-epimerase family protein [Pseudarthrobacter sp. AB1]|uniref:aldose 1-epimerase family protein n=1 Tax=Pseudarthrobacter sp. AB1 TaxID=2138309 RepID=UPI00186B86C3|nr:aldose 1-epimerase family protein [Pseudarthrobacter sp. AB1]MBE4720354.1 galactose mutarotase [Pseudarthrobacter sp. AB1]
MNGLEIQLVSGDYAAAVVQRGGALRRLVYQGRDLVVPFDAGAPIPDYRGIIAGPWPNRIADGIYRFAGVEHHLPINEPERGTSLHGLAFDRLWTVERSDADALSLSCEIAGAAGYPFHLRLLLDYELDEAGLHTTVTASNIGYEAAPYGVCPHPYLLAGPAPLDEWEVQIPAGSFLEVTPDRLLPVTTQTVQGHQFDFRAPRAIGATQIDHSFTDLEFDDGGRTQLIARDPGGTGVGMAWDRACPWLQVHTADKPAPAANRLGLAVEPMTCPPDAFNSGQDLVQLGPGSSHQAGWSIFAA